MFTNNSMIFFFNFTTLHNFHCKLFTKYENNYLFNKNITNLISVDVRNKDKITLTAIVYRMRFA